MRSLLNNGPTNLDTLREETGTAERLTHLCRQRLALGVQLCDACCAAPDSLGVLGLQLLQRKVCLLQLLPQVVGPGLDLDLMVLKTSGQQLRLQEQVKTTCLSYMYCHVSGRTCVPACLACESKCTSLPHGLFDVCNPPL